MSGINKVILIGRLGQDPELKYIGDNGSVVCNFSIATSERYKDKSGVQQEKTEWHRIVAWGKLAEICGEYLRKGRECYVEGKLSTRKWENKEGATQYTTEIVARDVQFLGSKNDGDVNRGGQSAKNSGDNFNGGNSYYDQKTDSIPF